VKPLQTVSVYLGLKGVEMNIYTLRTMRLIFTILAVFAVSSVFAMGSQTSGGTTDANGLRQNHWKIYNDTRHLPGYADNAVVEEGDYKDNMKQGVWISYFPSGAIKSKITFKDNRPEGYTISYFEDGKTQEEGTWSNNRWVGAYKLYYPNGQVQHDFSFNDNGKRTGQQTYNWPNGKPMIVGNWDENGKQSGLTTEYNEDGSIKAKEVFNNGNIDPSQSQTFDTKPATDQKAADIIPVPTQKEAPKSTTTEVKTDEQPNAGTAATAAKVFNGEGYWKLYNTNKQLSKDGLFHAGKLMDGTAYIYNADGILQKKAVYKGGIYQGDSPITEEDRK